MVPNTLAGTGYTSQEHHAPINAGEKGKGGHGKSNKPGRNFRWEGKTHASCKYEASGGMLRQAARKARHRAHQAALHSNAERRMNAVNRRLDRRIVKLAVRKVAAEMEVTLD